MEGENGLAILLGKYLATIEKHIVSRGKLIDVEKKNINRTIIRDGIVFDVHIMGTTRYALSITVNYGKKTVIGQCSCPYQKSCKHLAALCLSIIANQKKTTRSSRSTTTPRAKKEEVLIADKKNKTHTITGNSLQEIYKKVYSLPKKRSSDYYNLDLKNILVGNGLVKSEMYKQDWRYRSHNYSIFHTCYFTFTDESITIQCPDCSFYPRKLCNYALFALRDLLEEDVVYEDQYLEYDLIIESIAKSDGLSQDYLREYAEVFLDNSSMSFSITDPAVIAKDSLAGIMEKSSKVKIKRDKELLQSLEEQNVKGEAFVWSSETGLESQNLFFIISGKLNNTSTKLSSHITEIERPVMLSPGGITLFWELQKCMVDERSNEYEEDLGFVENFVLLMKKDLNHLQADINYYYNPEGGYRNYDNRLMKKDLKLIRFSDHFLKVRVEASVDNNLYVLRLICRIGDEEFSLFELSEVRVSLLFVLLGDTAYVYDNPVTYKLMQIFDGRDLIKFLPRNTLEYFKLLHDLKKDFMLAQDESLAERQMTVTEMSKKIILKEIGENVVFYPMLSKNEIEYNLLDIQPLVQDKIVSVPDYDEVHNFKNQFEELHPSFGRITDGVSFGHLHVNKYIANDWHLKFFEKCEKENISLEGLDSLEKIKFSKHKAVIETDLSSKIDWFELDVTLVFGEEKIPRKKWIKALKEGKSVIELKDGSLGIIPEEWIAQMQKILAIADVSAKSIQINKLRFNIIDELFAGIDNKSVLEEISAKKKLLKSYDDLANKKEIPSIVTATLRPYQEASFQWMQFLQSSGFGGILADDMGLGKTLQIICLLAAAKDKGKCHALVVVPKSLVFNWVNEIDKFCPSLTSHVHHGVQRKLAVKEMKKADVVVSTYGTVVNDIEDLRKRKFTHIILDESQAIKNPTSKRYKSIRLLKSNFKLCATGTPIQNNTFDLYTQASFANPGLLGNQTYFRQNFATPIDKNQDRDASELLQKMIHPFILRRTKEQVAKDLPDKVESIIYCELYPHQRKMYEELKEQIRRDLLQLSEDDSQLKFMVLDGLLRLRQLCNSPLLVDNKLKGKKAESIKIDSLIYKLTEEIGGGSALVFSQFVQMLSLIRKELDDKGIPYAYLDGSTNNREAVVKKYMEDDECKIFLISLKAGNTGLNLTKAQYVFLVDPWWNPAAEAQAIDRTHRIGQTQKVFAYKMICKDTVEEKIILLQNKKKKVANQLIKIDDSSFKSMDKKDLMALFD